MNVFVFYPKVLDLKKTLVFDHEQPSKVLKEALLLLFLFLLFLLAWNHQSRSKNCAWEQKNVPASQNEDHRVPIAMEVKFYLHIMELNGHVYLVCPCVALNGLMWPRMVFLHFKAMAT